MPAIVVVGMQWGDEAKGKIVDVLSRHMDVCVRYNGGPNAGHKVVFDGQTHVHHVIPSGIHNPGTLCLVCDGLVIDPKELSVEIDGLRKRGVRLDNLHIRNRTRDHAVAQDGGTRGRDETRRRQDRHPPCAASGRATRTRRAAGLPSAWAIS